MLKALELHRAGLGFYCLRHTFETIGGDTGDQVAVDAITGPCREDMASLFRERVNEDRLRRVTEHVREWLFSPGKKDEAGEGQDSREAGAITVWGSVALRLAIAYKAMGYGDALFCLTPDKRVSAANFAEMIPRMAVYDAVICERPHPPIAPKRQVSENTNHLVGTHPGASYASEFVRFAPKPGTERKPASRRWMNGRE